MAEIKKVAVAARGDIALRVLSACREMGLKVVLLYASGDTEQEAFRWADETICIGPSDPSLSYLNIEANIDGALAGGASAIHPGCGFLSESSAFAKQCEQRGLIFIGPGSKSLSLFGNKILAREKAAKAGIPVLPACLLEDPNEFKELKASIHRRADQGLKDHNKLKELKSLFEKAEEKKPNHSDLKKLKQLSLSDKQVSLKSKDPNHLKVLKGLSFPLMIKSVFGGGGRGIRLVSSMDQLERFLPSARSEALQSFGDGRLFLEKYLSHAKHIEIQVFVSAEGGVFTLGSRDGSVQRRGQKMIEEAQAQLSSKLRHRLEESAREILLGLDYRGVGTVEFLVQGEDFYFLEVNARLQLEHTVTEMIYGLDLVKAQILTAMGRPAFLSPREVLQSRGHSIQCRVCAEDPEQGLRPTAGKLLFCQWPQGKDIRVETGFCSGDSLSPLYDSLIGKVVVWEESRTRAVEKMKKALAKTVIFGLPSNISFLDFILSREEFLSRDMQTDSAEKLFAKDWQNRGMECPLPEDLLKTVFDELKPPPPSSPKSLERKSYNPWSDFLKV